ncbi:methyl-accepting chemotaxis protein [Pleionea mediterranea]|uniref:Methyl-accepting chemotaxis protein n=1 Tax=Pleionea mediterranea TaxID=523701 RepID=A0A316G026_9GAMM|nr:methyl-accepting chemotaxis protein [Pleionea mediterranea]PWK54251.1 methyl-accepting chemotaxis protein [Pleionea mediterranea]
MSWKNLSITWKLAIPVGIVAILILVLTSIQLSSMRIVTNDFISIHENYNPALKMVLNADRDLYQARLAERSIALGLQDSDLNASYQENIKQVSDRLTRVKSLNINDTSKADVNNALEAFKRWQQGADNLIQGLQAGNLTQSQATALSAGPLKDEFEALRNQLDTLGEHLSDKSSEYAQEVHQVSENSTTLIVIVSAVTIVLALLVAFIFPRMITSGLRAMYKALQQMAKGRGDLTYRLPESSDDEVGKMSKSFNVFLSSQQEMVANIKQASSKVDDSSLTISDAINSSQQILRNQADSVSLVATAVTQMSSAINEVSGNSQHVAEETGEADKSAKNAAAIFSQSISEISELADNVNNSAEVIQRLEAEASGIVLVLDVIKGIAEQTNLLALNAAIEAARAGEQGRGFAVVADEVRTLASKTQESTEQINEIIDRLLNGVKEAVTIMSSSQSRASATVDSSRKAQSTLEDVNNYLSSINERIIQVATAVEEQSAVVNDINQNVENINEISQEATAQGEKVASASQSLIEVSGELKREVSNFKV